MLALEAGVELEPYGLGPGGGLQAPFLDISPSGLDQWGLSPSDIIDVRSLCYDRSRRVLYVGCTSSDVQQRGLVIARTGEDGVTVGPPTTFLAHPTPSPVKQYIYVQPCSASACTLRGKSFTSGFLEEVRFFGFRSG
jgi:hypothetical protein